jgi:hypothetical protein
MSERTDYVTLTHSAINDMANDAGTRYAWAAQYTKATAPVAYALLALAQEVGGVADAVDGGDLSRELGGAVERGMDSAAQDISNAIERGLSEIAKAIGEIDRG